MKALLHSMEDAMHSHTQEPVDVKLIERKKDYMIVEKEDGTRCTAIYNPFCGIVFADDVYGVIYEH